MVSIITPFYNAEKYIAESISSVLNQTIKNWELLLINDGSTDRSKEIALSFKDERIRYFEQSNNGVSNARNFGLSKMKGDYFCFLDADDVLTPNSLEDRLEIFDKYSDVNFVDGEVIVTKENIAVIEYRWTPKYNLINPQKRLSRLDEKIFVTVSWMFRRDPNVSYDFNTNMTHAEDLWFFIKYSQKGLYAACNTPILHFRRTGNSAMSNLQGLESGYNSLIKLLYEYIAESNYNKGDVIYSRLKTKKIMFLSYLSQGMYLSAVISLFKT